MATQLIDLSKLNFNNLYWLRASDLTTVTKVTGFLEDSMPDYPAMLIDVTKPVDNYMYSPSTKTWSYTGMIIHGSESSLAAQEAQRFFAPNVKRKIDNFFWYEKSFSEGLTSDEKSSYVEWNTYYETILRGYDAALPKNPTPLPTYTTPISQAVSAYIDVRDMKTYLLNGYSSDVITNFPAIRINLTSLDRNLMAQPGYYYKYSTPAYSKTSWAKSQPLEADLIAAAKDARDDYLAAITSIYMNKLNNYDLPSSYDWIVQQSLGILPASSLAVLKVLLKFYDDLVHMDFSSSKSIVWPAFPAEFIKFHPIKS